MSAVWVQQTAADNHPDPITVGAAGDHATIQAALDAVLDGGTIEVDAATYTENIVIPAGISVTVVGHAAAPADTVISGVVASGLPTVTVPGTSTLVLQNLRVTGGEFSGIANIGNLTLNNVVVSGNTRVGDGQGGGGIRSLTSSALSVLNGSVIEDNSVTGAEGDGGGIWSFESTVTITDSTIRNNTARRRGGGVSALSPATVLSVTGSTISGNATQGLADGSNGGGIASAGIFTLIDSTITGNTAASVGGGIYNTFSGAMSITGNTTISNNHAVGAGGGIFNSGFTEEGLFQGSGTITGAGVLITSNTADGDGGGIYNFGQLTIIDATIADNATAATGGGIYQSSSSPALSMTGGTIDGNQAATSGGGISIAGAATLTDVTITNNEVTGVNGFGGGIRCCGDTGTVIINGGSIGTTGNGNSAFLGGGIAQHGGTLEITPGAVIRGNSATIGGGIGAWAGTLTMFSGEIRNNTATDTGGGVWTAYTTDGEGGALIGVATINLVGASLTENSALRGGAAFLNRGALGITMSPITGNTTTELPSAAIHNYGGTLFAYGVTFAGNGSGGPVGTGQVLHVDARDGAVLVQAAVSTVRAAQFPLFDAGVHFFTAHATNGFDGGAATNPLDARFSWWGSDAAPTADAGYGSASVGNVLVDPQCLIDVCTAAQLIANVTGNGTLTLFNQGFDCVEGTCTPQASPGVGQNVTITAAPAAGYVLGAWGGACTAGTVFIPLASTTPEVVCTVSFVPVPPPPPPPPAGGVVAPPPPTTTPVQDAGGVTVNVGGRQTIPAPPSTGTSATIETTSNGSTARVTVPPGAIPGATEVALGAIENVQDLIAQASPPQGVALVLAFHIEAKDADDNNVTDGFTESVGIEFVVPLDSLPVGASDRELLVAFWNGESWVEVPAALTVNDDGTVTLNATVNHFTIFKVAHRPGMRSYAQTIVPSRVTFTVWGGGMIADAMTSSTASIDSIWVVIGGRFYGYRADAPVFANQAFRSQFTADYIPGNTPVFVVTR